MKQAIRTGKPVLVAAETTPTVAELARPDGLLSMTSNVFPVRAKVNGVWKKLDPKLRKTAGGSWAPAVASVPVTFSAGGRGPLVTVAASPGQRCAGHSVAMSWPATLPRPVISGSIALYKNVLPGVDLRMQATGTGYQETLIVRDARAAADPGLRSLALKVKVGPGLLLSVDPILSPGNPQTMTGYTYAADNPVTGSDPSGMVTVDDNGDVVIHLTTAVAAAARSTATATSRSAGSPSTALTATALTPTTATSATDTFPTAAADSTCRTG